MGKTSTVAVRPAETRSERARALRADAARNRARVVKAAIEAFRSEGLSVPIHEIARRAGVGTGTVSRHFPTKEALFEAIILDRAEQVVLRANTLASSEDPGKAFFDFMLMMVDEFAAHVGLHDALAGAGYDIEHATASPKHDVMAAVRRLLARAQRVGAVRKDVEVSDVKALVLASIARSGARADATVRRRMVEIVSQGLKPARR